MDCLPRQQLWKLSRRMSPLPLEPWHTVQMDSVVHFLWVSFYLLSLMHTQFPEVDIVHSTSASAIISRWIEFSPFMVCHLYVVKSDNGPPFASDEVKEYMEENGIKHCRVTPL